MTVWICDHCRKAPCLSSHQDQRPQDPCGRRAVRRTVPFRGCFWRQQHQGSRLRQEIPSQHPSSPSQPPCLCLLHHRHCSPRLLRHHFPRPLHHHFLQRHLHLHPPHRRLPPPCLCLLHHRHCSPRLLRHHF